MKFSKIAILSLFVLSYLGVSPASVNAQGFPKTSLEILVPETVFIPKGFDNNDPNVQIVAYGYMPSTCFRAAPPDVKVDAESGRVSIAYQAYYYPNSWCVMTPVPFKQVYDLGQLKTGSYEVWVKGRDQKFKKWESAALPVTEPVNKQGAGPDDNPYAIANSIGLDPLHPGRAILTVSLPSKCIELDGKPEVSGLLVNVVQVRPIVKQVNNNCLREITTVDIPIELPADAKGDTLLHVRSLNGQALNEVVTLK